MTIFTHGQPLVWGGLDVPLFGLARDLAGQPLEVPAAFSLVADPQHLWLIANHRRPALIHPKAASVKAGIIHIVERQEDGWSYIKAGF